MIVDTISSLLAAFVGLAWIISINKSNKLLKQQNKLLQQYIDLKERNDLE